MLAFFRGSVCHFLFLEKKKVTPPVGGHAPKIQERNETAHSFPRSLIKLVYYCGAATFGFHAYSFEETSSRETIFLQRVSQRLFPRPSKKGVKKMDSSGVKK